MLSTDFIALIRCAPDTDEAVRLGQWLQRQQSGGVLFFQACGVEHAALAAPFGGLNTERFRMRVCEGSWRRRYDREPPGPFAIGSLVELFSRLDQGLHLECFRARG